MKPFVLAVTLLLYGISLAAQQPAFSWLHYSGAGFNDQGTDIITDAGGNVFTGGHFRDSIDLNGILPGMVTGVDQWDAFLAKYDSSGNLVWTLHLGTTGNEYIKSVNLDSSGRILITGTFQDPFDFDPGPGTAVLSPMGLTGLFIACYDTAGSYQWANRIGSNITTTSTDMAIGPAGDIFLLGSFLGSCDFDPSSPAAVLTAPYNSLFAARYDANGNYLNVFALYDSIVGVAIEVNQQSDVFITGSFTGYADFNPSSTDSAMLVTSVMLPDIFFAKYTSAGNYIWAKQISGPGSEYATGLKSNGGATIFLTGHYNDTVDFDPGAGVHLTASSGVDAFVARYDTSGALSWVNSMGWTGHDEIQAIDLHPDGSVCVAGRFYMNCDVDPSGNTVNLTAPDYSLFVASYAVASGDFIWAFAPENSTESGAGDLSVSSTGGIHITGQFSDVLDFDPDTGTAMATGSIFQTDLFIVKYLPGQIAGIPEYTVGLIGAYPNPTQHTITIPLERSFRTTTISVFDCNGRLISTTSHLNTDLAEFTIDGPAGTYMVVVATEAEPMRFLQVVKSE